MSVVLSERLDELVALINVEGNLPSRIYRSELLSALIALAPETASELETLIRTYTDLSVRDALVGDAKNATVIELRPPKPGRKALPPA